MSFNPYRHHRRSIRLQGYDYSQPGAYFVTICAHHRECLFGTIVHEKMALNEFGSIARDAWVDLPNHYQRVQLDAFIVMPNHVHGIIGLSDGVGLEHAGVNPGGAIHVVGAGSEPTRHGGAIHESPRPESYKQMITRRRRMLLPKIIGRFKMNSARQINILRETSGLPVWQRNYFERIIRDEKQHNAIRTYIANNPVRWFHDTENPDIAKSPFVG